MFNFFTTEIPLYAIIGYAVGGFSIIFLFLVGKIDKFKYKGLEIHGKFTPKIPKPFIYDKDVIIYRSFLRLIIVDNGGILSDIRSRVRANGWDKRDWPTYREAAIDRHIRYITEFLNDFYPSDMVVDRITLYEWNRIIRDQIKDRFRQMYNEMYRIFMDSHAETNLMKEKLYNGTCDGNQGGPCNSLIHAMEVFSQIYNLENQETPKQCMNEAERALGDIQQQLFSRFLTIYKQKKGES